jgi:hypothetical protein
MAFDITFPGQGNIVEFRLRGVLTFDTFSRLHQGLYFSPDWRTGMNCLGILEKGTDISAITLETMRSELREEVDRIRRLRGPEFKMAWIAEDEHNLPIVRLWKTMPFVANQYEVEVFRQADAGRDWLRKFERSRLTIS